MGSAMIKVIVFALLAASTAIAGLPPTTTKAVGDSTPVTTFEFDFPTFTVTRAGTRSIFTPNNYITATAGENLSAGNVVYISVGSGSGDSGRTAGYAYKADATNSLRIEWVGIVQTSVSSGASVTIINNGNVTGLSSLTTGTPSYVDPAAPGALTSTAPTTATYFISPVGVATSATTLLLNGAGPATTTYIDSVPNGAPTVTGTRASPSSIVAGTGISFTANHIYNIWFIQGSGGAVTVTANPQISAGTTVGQKLTLIGRSDTNTVTISNGTGLSLNSSAVLGADDVIQLIWDGTNWTEMSRSF
jgi:hypothetical protein